MSEEERVIIAAVEGGGTSFVVAVAELVGGSSPKILFTSEVDSSHDKPLQTLEQCCIFFRQHKPKDGYHALGIATFGPVGLVESRPTYGRILASSPKQSWRNVDFLTPLSDACRGTRPLHVKVDTDVNAPAFAEYLLAKGKISSVAYITVGTGVGVGLVIHGRPVHGRMHPEGGHVPVMPLPLDDFGGYSWGEKCPFRGHQTVEGLASSVALTERLEKILGEKDLPRSRLADLEDDHEVWNHAANALANLCVTLILTTSVERIVLGGGIMNRRGLIEKIRKQTVVLLNGYLDLPSDMSELIATSPYGSHIGLIGAMVLAQRAHEAANENPSKSEKPSFSNFNVGLIHGAVVGFAAAYLLTRRGR